ncbi:MAG: PDDEXK nuclease domain-containing protein [Candidatus Coatesbacteria bacterium]
MNYLTLIKAITAVHRESAARAVVAVNQALVLRNWIIGGHIVEYQQEGKDRAAYGAGLLTRLSEDLVRKGVAGTSPDMLERMRLLHLHYPQLAPISAPAVRKSLKAGKPAPSARNSCVSSPTPLSRDAVLRFSWTHLAELVRLEDPWKRAFYENEILRGNWSKRQLQRQIGSLLFERTGLSTNKRAVIDAARRQADGARDGIADLIRDPYVLEFVGLAEQHHLRESDLETALLDHLRAFLLELGTGFCFEARQKRITVGNEHDYIDLVFYHRVLRCHLLIDLKIRAFRHADAGQMNFYLNYWKDRMMAEGDQPPVGLLLCSDKDEAKVEYATAGLDKSLFVSRYLVSLPKPDDIRHLLEVDRARLDRENGNR